MRCDLGIHSELRTRTRADFANICFSNIVRDDYALSPGLVCSAEEATMAFSDQQAAEPKTDFTARTSYRGC